MKKPLTFEEWYREQSGGASFEDMNHGRLIVHVMKDCTDSMQLYATYVMECMVADS